MNPKLIKYLFLGCSFAISCLILYFTIHQVSTLPANTEKFKEEKVQTPQGQIFNLPLERPSKITLDPDSTLWITTKSHVHSLDKKLQIKEQVSLSHPPTDLIAQSSRRLIILSTRHLIFLNKESASWQERVLKLGQENSFFTTLISSEDQLYIADAGKKELLATTMEGNKLWSSKGFEGFSIPSPYMGMAPDGEGGVWVVNSGKHQIERYSKKGKYISLWLPKKTNPFLGCCNPTHIALQSGLQFITLEKGKIRSRLFNPAGKLIKILASSTEFKPQIFGSFDLDMTVSSEGKVYILDPQAKQLKVYTL